MWYRMMNPYCRIYKWPESIVVAGCCHGRLIPFMKPPCIERVNEVLYLQAVPCEPGNALLLPKKTKRKE